MLCASSPHIRDARRRRRIPAAIRGAARLDQPHDPSSRLKRAIPASRSGYTATVLFVLGLADRLAISPPREMTLAAVFSSKLRPTGSFFGAARSPSRSARPSTKRTVAYIPDRDAGIALFNLDEGRAADRGALRRDGRRDPPPPPGVTDVAAELAASIPYRSGMTTDDRLVSHISVQYNGR